MKRVIFITAVIVIFVSIMAVHASAAENKVYTGFVDDEGYYYLDGMPDPGEYSLSFSYSLWSGQTGTISVDRLILSPVSDGLYTSFYAIVPAYGDQELYMSIEISGNYFSVGNDDVYFKTYENFKLVSLSSVEPEPDPDPPEPEPGPEPTLGPSFDVNEVYDYMDFVTDIKVEGDKDLVTVTLPSSMAMWVLSNDYDSYEFYGNNAIYHTHGTHNVALSPLGQNSLSLEDIPDGAVISFAMHITCDNKVFFESSEVDVVLSDFYGVSVDYFTDSVVDVAIADNEFILDYTFTLSKPSGAVDFSFSAIVVDVRSQFGTHVQYYCEDTQIQFQISSAYLEAQRTGKTNKLLEAIEGQLKEQGKTMEEIVDQQQQTNDKLDDIISGSQEDQDAADGFKDQVTDQNQAIQDAEDAIDSAIKFDDKPVLNFFVELVNKIDIPYANVLALFWEWTLLHDLLLMASIFALLSFILFGKKG